MTSLRARRRVIVDGEHLVAGVNACALARRARHHRLDARAAEAARAASCSPIHGAPRQRATDDNNTTRSSFFMRTRASETSGPPSRS